jgi:hypothetical protein
MGKGWQSREIKLKELKHEECDIALGKWNSQWSHMQLYVGWALLFASVTCLQGYIRWDPFVLRAHPLDISLLGLCWDNEMLLPANVLQSSVSQLEIPATLIFFFIHLFICAYIVWAISPPIPCPLHLAPTLSLPGRICSDLFSNFVEE